MTRIALCLSLSLLVFPACKKKDDAAGKGSAATAEKTTDKGGDKAAPAAGPVKTTPKDLFAEFGEGNKADPMALMDKYKDGATFSGVVKTAPGDAAPTSAIMDVDGKNMIMMDFKDAAAVKAVKAGDTITATCKIGGESGAMMQVNDCELAK
jgi:hypothetical protein